MRMPRADAAFNSSIKSLLLLGMLPAPYVCRITPSIGGWKNVFTYNVEINPLFTHNLYILEQLHVVCERPLIGMTFNVLLAIKTCCSSRLTVFRFAMFKM
jgi:hypothetical protein